MSVSPHKCRTCGEDMVACYGTGDAQQQWCRYCGSLSWLENTGMYQGWKRVWGVPKVRLEAIGVPLGLHCLALGLAVLAGCALGYHLGGGQ